MIDEIMNTYTRLTPGQKPPQGSTVTLCYGSGDSRRELEYFAADDNPDWVCPNTSEGHWYGYQTSEELAAIERHFVG